MSGSEEDDFVAAESGGEDVASDQALELGNVVPFGRPTYHHPALHLVSALHLSGFLLPCVSISICFLA
jgi:hypothetical protein